MAFIEEDEIDRIANRLEDEAPWETVSKVLSHQGWIDVVTTIHATCPDAYEEMKKTYMEVK